MMCQECNKRQATVHITKIINGKKTELHLCEVCAKQKQIGFSKVTDPFNFESGFSIGKLLSSFFDYPDQEQESREKECGRCGISFPRFTETGKFGCSNCYDTFRDQTTPLLRRIHGKTYHVGKVPRRTGSKLRLKTKLNKLKRELQEAVNAEEYERAAVLRDRIKEMEKNNDKE